MRWKKLIDWGPGHLKADEWAPLSAEIAAPDLDAVEQTLDELTGFMEFFRETLDGAPLTGVTDGQLAVTHGYGSDTWGRPVLRVTFYAGGPVGVGSPDAFQRLGRAASALTDELQAGGVTVDSIRWTEQPYIKRPF